MARIFTENFETGPVGAAITTANTGFTTAPSADAVFVGSGAVGTLAARLTTPATAANRIFIANSTVVGVRSVLYASMYISMGSLPPGNWYVMGARGAGAARAQVVINSNGTLSVRNGNSTVYTSPELVPTATIVRLEWRLDFNAGVQTVRVYNYNSTTPLFTTGAQTFNTGTIDTFQVGVLVAVANISVVIDWLALDDSTWVGPAVVGTPPTVNAGADQTGKAAGSTVTITGTASDPDGSIASTSWTQTGGPTVTLSGTGLSRTFTAPSQSSPSTLTFRFSATDNSGLSSSDTMTVGVLASGGGGGPTVSAGVNQTVEPWDVFTLIGTASKAGGSIASADWTQVSGAPVTLLNVDRDTRRVEAPGLITGDVAVFRYTATDNLGNSAYDDVQVTTYAVTEMAVIGGVLQPLRPTKVQPSGGFGRTPFGTGPFGG